MIKYVAGHTDSTPSDVRAVINKPWTTVMRQLEALYQLSVLDIDEVEEENRKGEKISRPYYSLVLDIDASVATYDLPWSRSIRQTHGRARPRPLGPPPR